MGLALSAVLFACLVVVLSRAIGDADATSVILGATIGVLAAVPQFLSLIRWPFLIPLPRARARGSEGARRLRTAPIRAKQQRWLLRARLLLLIQQRQPFLGMRAQGRPRLTPRPGSRM
ncbi:MAG: hypothetical protein M3515_06705 [Actinomycetota bacterium]|nr:hypothetical protein [Actinomycetota bacterium]